MMRKHPASPCCVPWPFWPPAAREKPLNWTPTPATPPPPVHCRSGGRGPVGRGRLWTSCPPSWRDEPYVDGACPTGSMPPPQSGSCSSTRSAAPPMRARNTSCGLESSPTSGRPSAWRRPCPSASAALAWGDYDGDGTEEYALYLWSPGDRHRPHPVRAGGGCAGPSTPTPLRTTAPSSRCPELPLDEGGTVTLRYGGVTPSSYTPGAGGVRSPPPPWRTSPRWPSSPPAETGSPPPLGRAQSRRQQRLFRPRPGHHGLRRGGLRPLGPAGAVHPRRLTGRRTASGKRRESVGRPKDGDHAGAPPAAPHGLAHDALHAHPGPLQSGGLHVRLPAQRLGLSGPVPGLSGADVHGGRVRGHRRGGQRPSLPPSGRGGPGGGRGGGPERRLRLSPLLGGFFVLRALSHPALPGLLHPGRRHHRRRQRLPLHRHRGLPGHDHAVRHRAHPAGHRGPGGAHGHPGHRGGGQPGGGPPADLRSRPLPRPGGGGGRHRHRPGPVGGHGHGLFPGPPPEAPRPSPSGASGPRGRSSGRSTASASPPSPCSPSPQ